MSKTNMSTPEPDNQKLEGVEPEEKESLNDPNVSDLALAVPRKLSELTLADVESPLQPLPVDGVSDVYYPTKYEPRCVLCRTPEEIRQRAEHWYIEQGQKPSAVVHFLMRYWGARVSWECVATHMQDHCSLGNIWKSGLEGIRRREEDISTWKYRELELVINTLLVELDEVRAIHTKNNPELLLKRSARVESITKSLRDATKQRDELGTNSVNIFQVLKDLFDLITDPDSKHVVRQYVKDLRERLADG